MISLHAFFITMIKSAIDSLIIKSDGFDKPGRPSIYSDEVFHQTYF